MHFKHPSQDIRMRQMLFMSRKIMTIKESISMVVLLLEDSFFGRWIDLTSHMTIRIEWKCFSACSVISTAATRFMHQRFCNTLQLTAD
mmetsp:Transcript_16126/g.30463  ORF Transcript_16126/g.30463 Transcript_16126/m.30463 type:complete len:88 (-) Transcript_16126:85-348(-)